MNKLCLLLICGILSGCVTTKLQPVVTFPVIPSNLLIPPVDMMLITPVSPPITKVDKNDGTNTQQR